MNEVCILIEEHHGQTLFPTGVYTTYGGAVDAASKILRSRHPGCSIIIHKDTVRVSNTEYEFKIHPYKVEE